ncbi:hypothetical protein HanRHA438_Chr16g0783141 [Helianthus annuus]|nr:hypothetical protein HanRHA438_Chr16g0783141 [Helianthus annuus]
MIHTKSFAKISKVCRFGQLLINSRAHDNSKPSYTSIVDNLRVLRQGKAVVHFLLALSFVSYKKSGKSTS